jgi:hypothetical protein
MSEHTPEPWSTAELERRCKEAERLLAIVRQQVSHGHGINRVSLPHCPRCRVLAEAEAFLEAHP